MSTAHPIHGRLSPEQAVLLQERALAVAAPTGALSGAAAAEHIESFLLLQMASERYGLPLSCVEEVIDITSRVNLPRAPQHVIGLTRVRGKVLALVDLRRFWHGRLHGYADHDRAVIINVADVTCGLVCSRTIGPLDLEPQDREPPPDNLPPALKHCLSGMLHGSVLLLDPMALVQQPGFVVS